MDAGGAAEGTHAVRNDQVWSIRKARSRYRVRVLTAQAGLTLVLLATWQAVGVNNPLFLSYPSAIWERLYRWMVEGSLWFHLLFTGQATLLGFAAGGVAGVAAGFVLGRNVFWADVLDVFITSVNSLPKIALAPLVVLWFGIGLLPKIVLAGVIVFFFVFTNTYTGVREVDPDLIDVVRVMGANESQLAAKIIFPHALTWIFVGFKLAAPYALIGAVMGEIIASNRGVGYLIAGSGNRFDTAGLFAGLLVLLVLSSVMNALIGRSERLWSGWKQAGTEGRGGIGVA